MDLGKRREMLNQLRTEVTKYVASERKRLTDERTFLEAVKDRSVNKAQAPHGVEAAKIATEYVRTLVGLDMSFDPDAGVT
jgi:hypothetical protein